MRGEHTRFYLDKQNAKVMGVCSGLADYTGIDPLLVRMGVLGIVFMSGGSLFPVYFLIGIMANRKPQHLYTNDSGVQKFWQQVRRSPRRSAREVKARFRELDRRLADVELYYTSNNRALSDEIEKLR